MLVLLTAVFAVIHLTTRTSDIDGEILVNGESVKIADLQMSTVEGTVVNGKGEEKQIDSQGLPLSQVCTEEFETVTVTASDEYHAVVAADEIQNAYLILDDEGNLRLIVFGDENSKRDVKNVVRIDTK